MRSSPYLLLAVAGFGLIVLSTPRADAMTSTSPAALRAGLEAVNLTEPVHCRSYNHKVVGGHGWGKGCKPGVVVIREGSSSGPSINIRSGSTRSGSGGGSGTSAAPAASGSTSTTTNTTTNTGTGAGATTSTSTKTGGATYTGAGAGATSTTATTTTGGATTTTGGTSPSQAAAPQR